jgi:Zn-dependent protease
VPQSEAIGKPVPGATPGAPHKGVFKWLAGLGTVGLLLLKFKFIPLFLLGKGKLLLLGLTQAKTFLSMAIAAGVYTTIFGWWFALGLVVSIYIHEMGHVAWLARYGIAASAPMFIPGVGAFVRLKQHPATVAEDARVGLAGPVWGAAAAAVALVLGSVLEVPILTAIGRVGAWINLFNLLPVWQLDGGRAFAALSRQQRGVVAGALWLLALVGGDGVLFLLAIAATARAAMKGSAPEEGDLSVLVAYLVLAFGLTAMMAAGDGPPL